MMRVCFATLFATFTYLAAVSAGNVGGNIHTDGTPIQADLPGRYHMKNVGGRDGAGLCVFTSINHAAHLQDVEVLKDFQAWMKQHPGGGYPEKVRAMIARKCKEKGVPEPLYVQVEGDDLEILKLACRTGRMPGVTYCWSPTGRYNGQRIAHMVSLVAAGVGKGPDGKGWWVILDNNYPGEGKYEWLSEAEFKKTYTGMGGGWCVILLGHPPPPPPRN